MKCGNEFKEMTCDLPTPHDGLAHINKDKQTFWTDTGVSWSTDWIVYWQELPLELQQLVDQSRTGLK